MAIPQLHAAQDATWHGDHANPDVTNGDNWDFSINPGTSAIFGDIEISSYAPYIPSGKSISLTNIVFTGSARNPYIFSGDAELHSQLHLSGNVTLQSRGDVTFNDTVEVVLTSGEHDVSVFDDTKLTVAGKVTAASGVTSIVKSGKGTLVLSGDNTFNGGLTIAAGTITLASSSHTPDAHSIDYSPVGTGALTINNTATLSVLGNGVTLLNDIVLAGAAGAQQNFYTPIGNSLTLGDGSLGSITGEGRLVKTGLGTLTLTTANNYHGGTSVGGGILAIGNASALGDGNLVLDGGAIRLINGLHSITNNIVFDSAHGGTLGGNWTFSTPQTFGAGVTLSPGNSPGAMTFNAGLTLTGGSADFEFRAPTGTPGTDWDFYSITGDFNLAGLATGGGYTLRVISLDLANTQGAPISGLASTTSWIIASATTITGFNAADFTIDSSQFNGGGIFSLTQSGGNLVLNFTAVPEPSTYALMGLGLGLSGLAAWRKRRRA